MSQPLLHDLTIQGGIKDGEGVKVLDNIRLLINQLRNLDLYSSLGNPLFVISTNFDAKNTNAISYLNNGTVKTLAANTNFDTGTTKTIATTQWAAALLTVSAAGSAVLTWTTANFASEALAIAALVAPAATDTILGYLTNQAAGSTWTAGTDALQGGTGGTPATTTNYFNGFAGLPTGVHPLSEPVITLLKG